MGSNNEKYRNSEVRESARRLSHKFWLLLVVLVTVWSVLIIVPPIAAANEASGTASGLYSFFGYICHQLPDRSFFMLGHKFGVCSRCSGVYFGLVLGALAYPIFRSISDVRPLPIFWLILSMIPITIDWSLTMLGIWENTYFTRFTTGLVLGTACSVYVIPALSELSHMLSLRNTPPIEGT
ncbi:MAG: DUF2085 domain-containing protein [Pyrinomonadaceae bacterium]|nr:DUF2085 domain-containing protein [Pyrinomonadaceae bacterium]